MTSFTYKDVYEEEGKRVLELNVLPDKYCNFECIICPIGRTKNKLDSPQDFGCIGEDLEELSQRLNMEKPDLVFINSKGEALIHGRIKEIIDFIRKRNVPIRLLTNGYLLGKKEYMEIASCCEEVLGEIKLVTEAAFQKVQRPMEGYTLAEYIDNMAAFRSQYNGNFLFEITIIKGYNDSTEDVERLKTIIGRLRPDRLIVIRLEDERFRKKLWLEDERFEKIKKQLEETVGAF